MPTIAFQAKILNGAIEVPEEYRAQLGEIVRVTLVTESEGTSSTLIDRLLNNPIQMNDFVPFSKDEIRGQTQW